MNRHEAAQQLEYLMEEMYRILHETKKIIEEVSPEAYERAKRYWMAHIDQALENRGEWIGESVVTMKDTILEIEEGRDE